MKIRFKSFAAFPLLLVCAAGSAPLAAVAQDNGTNGPPKILVIDREYTRPGKGGALHERTEGAFIAAVKGGRGPLHYLAMTSLSGPDRALFFSGYPSLAAWDDENQKVSKNASMAAAMDRTMAADGDLLSSTDESVWARQDDMSMNSGNLVGARYMEITVFQIKPGHAAEWEALVKMVKEGYAKGIPEASWTMFRELYGSPGEGYIVVEPLKSLAEEDQHLAGSKQFSDAMGAEGMKKLEQMEASCVEMEQTNLFRFSPKMSIPPEEWIQAEPDYWKPKTPTPARKSAPAAQPQQ